MDYCETHDNENPDDIRSEMQQLFSPGLLVQTSEGEIFPIDSQGMISLLEQSFTGNIDPKNLGTYLNTLLEYLRSSENEHMTSTEWKKRIVRLEEIYSTGEFRGLQERKIPFWIQHLDDLFKAFRSWLVEYMEGISHIPSGLGKTLLFTIYGLILMLGGFVIFRIVRSSGWAVRRSRGGKASPKATELPETPDWNSLRNDAFGKASDGQLREAIRWFFISVLMEGHVKGWWIYEPETTNQQHLARIKGPVDRLKAMISLVGIYEKAWYGLGHPGEGEYQKCQELARRIETA